MCIKFSKFVFDFRFFKRFLNKVNIEKCCMYGPQIETHRLIMKNIIKTKNEKEKKIVGRQPPQAAPIPPLKRGRAWVSHTPPPSVSGMQGVGLYRRFH
jgi:hypothetical protein